VIPVLLLEPNNLTTLDVSPQMDLKIQVLNKIVKRLTLLLDSVLLALMILYTSLIVHLKIAS